MIIISKTYPIGTGAGQYPAGTTITDSFIGLAPIGSITINAQNHNTGLSVTGDCLDFSASTVVTVNGDYLTINFSQGIKINE